MRHHGGGNRMLGSRQDDRCAPSRASGTRCDREAMSFRQDSSVVDGSLPTLRSRRGRYFDLAGAVFQRGNLRALRASFFQA